MSRDRILARIRQALRIPTSPLVHPAAGPPPSAADARPFLPPVPADAAGRVQLFARIAAGLKADFHAVPDLAAGHALLRDMAQGQGWTSVASHDGPLTDAACAVLGLPVVRTRRGYDRDALERCPVGITACEALIAQTGSVLVSARSSGGRALTCLPPHHIVLATADQLLGDLAEGYALLRTRYAGDWPSFIGLITGPSRTGDIERLLVLGAHGPKRLTIIMSAW